MACVMHAGYSSSDDYYDHPHSTSQDGYHDEDERQRLQQSIDVIWPDDEWLSPEEELLHTAADFLITVKPWCSPGQRPERYIAALATLGTTLRRHPCAHAVPGKLSRLFEDSPYFELCSEGRTALLRLDVQAVLDAADGAAGGGGGAGNMQSCECSLRQLGASMTGRGQGFQSGMHAAVQCKNELGLH